MAPHQSTCEWEQGLPPTSDYPTVSVHRDSLSWRPSLVQSVQLLDPHPEWPAPCGCLCSLGKLPHSLAKLCLSAIAISQPRQLQRTLVGVVTSLLIKSSGLRPPYPEVGPGLCLGDPEVNAKLTWREVYFQPYAWENEPGKKKVLTRMRVLGQIANQLAAPGWRRADCASKLRGRLYFQPGIFTTYYSGGDIWYLS